MDHPPTSPATPHSPSIRAHAPTHLHVAAVRVGKQVRAVPQADGHVRCKVPVALRVCDGAAEHRRQERGGHAGSFQAGPQRVVVAVPRQLAEQYAAGKEEAMEAVGGEDLGAGLGVEHLAPTLEHLGVGDEGEGDEGFSGGRGRGLAPTATGI